MDSLSHILYVQIQTVPDSSYVVVAGQVQLTGVVSGRLHPVTFRLEQNYPNPFNPTTTIKYNIGEVVAPARTTEENQVRSGGLSGAHLSGVEGRASTNVKLIVYDILGREVATLVNEVKQPGSYTVRWDASAFASGVYFCQLKAGTFAETRKILLVR